MVYKVDKKHMVFKEDKIRYSFIYENIVSILAAIHTVIHYTTIYCAFCCIMLAMLG